MERSYQKTFGFRPIFDQQQDILWFIPGEHAFAWIIILLVMVMPWVGLAQIVDESWVFHGVFGFLSLISIGIYTFLARNGAHTFLGEFYRPKAFHVARPNIEMSKSSLKPRVKVKKDLLTKETINPIENLTDLVAPFEMNLQGQTCGGYLLESGQTQTFAFVYELIGPSPYMSRDEAIAIANQIGEGLKDYSFSENLTLLYTSWCNAEEELEYLSFLIEQAPSEETQFLLSWRKRRAKQLVEKKIQKPKSLHLIFTFSPSRMDDSLEGVALSVFEASLKSLGIIRSKAVSTELETQGILAFERGYLNQRSFFSKLGFEVQPVTWKPAWKIGWRRLNLGDPPTCPLVIFFDENGVHYDYSGTIIEDEEGNIISDSPMVVSRLFFEGAPTFSKESVYLPGMNKFCGGLIWDEKPTRKYDSSERMDQLKHAVKPLFRKETLDTEIIVQFTRVDPDSAKRTAQALTSEANLSSNMINASSQEDRGVVRQRDLAIEADDLLRADTRLIKMAWVCLCYRDNEHELSQALSELENVYTGRIISRESNYFPSIWRETLPFTTRSLLRGGERLTEMFERRKNCNTHAVPAMLPLLHERSKDRTGIKFISESGTPFYYEPFLMNPFGHTITTAYTGGGKTVLEGAKMAHAACVGANAYFFDASKDGNVGALAPTVNFLGGGYFDPTKENSNLFEGADWRKMSDDKRKEGKVLFQTFLVGSIRDLAVGSVLNPAESRTVKNLLLYFISTYLGKPETQALYDAAFDSGLGSEAWQNMPTLVSFNQWMQFDLLPDDMKSDESKRLFKEIKSGLTSCMLRPAGAAISKPSTFDTNSKIVAFRIDTSGDDDDVLPLILSAQAIIISGALNANQTYVAYDEISRQFKRFPSLAETAAFLTAMGRSLQIWINLIGQTIQPIHECPQAADILSNVNSFLTGFITTKAVSPLEEVGIPRHLLVGATDDRKFKPKGRSRWIVSRGATHMVGDFWIDMALLGMLGNFKFEKAEREKYIGESKDKFEAYTKYSQYLEQKLS